MWNDDDSLINNFAALNIGDDDDQDHDHDRRGDESKTTTAMCAQMCPQDEIFFREKNGLLHRLELLNAADWDTYREQTCRKIREKKSESPFAEFERHNLRFTDSRRAVKRFTRSSAGQNLIVDSSKIRPTDVLRRTTDYLLRDLLRRVRTLFSKTTTGAAAKRFNHYYDFVFDRLRSIRQDMTIASMQRIGDANSRIYILEQCVEFYINSHYTWHRLEAENAKKESQQQQPKKRTNVVPNFDSHLNRKHLDECLLTLLRYYDYFSNSFWSRRRPLFEAIFLCANIFGENRTSSAAAAAAENRYQALRRSAIDRDLFRAPLMQIADRIIRAQLCANWIKPLRLIRSRFDSAPDSRLFCRSFCVANIADIHLNLLRQICVACRSPNAAARIEIRELACRWFCPDAFDPNRCSEYLFALVRELKIPHQFNQPKIDYFDFVDNHNRETSTGNDVDRDFGSILIGKKISNINPWRTLPPNVSFPIGWLPSTSSSSGRRGSDHFDNSF